MKWLQYFLPAFLFLRLQPRPAPAQLPPPPLPQAEPRRKKKPVQPKPVSFPQARMDSIVNPLSGLGTAGDKGVAAKPDTDRVPLALGEIDSLCRFGGFVRRYLDLVPDEATRKGWHIDDSTDDPDPLAEETKRLNIVQRIAETYKWARLYGGALIWVVVDEENPEGRSQESLLSTPLKAENIKRVLNLVICSRYEATPLTWVTDPRTPRFREPLLWSLYPYAQGGSSFMGMQVHYSRTIYIPGVRLPPMLRYANGGFDDSIFQTTWDAIRNKISIELAAGALAQEIKQTVLKVEGLAALSVSDQQALVTARVQMLAQTKSLLNVALIGDGEEWKTEATPINGFDSLNTTAERALSAATGIPQTLLFGEAPSGLNTDGESSRKWWDRSIGAVQTHILLEPLQILYRLLYAQKEGPTGGIIPDVWSIVFNPLDELTTTEQAKLEKEHAETDKIRVETGILPASHIAKSRYGDKGYQNTILPYEATETPESPLNLNDPNTVQGSYIPVQTQDAELPLKREIPAGDTRRGVDMNGQPWEVVMPCDYGELKGTMGLDGEPVDYLHVVDGPRGTAFVVDQMLPAEEGAGVELDEQKVILGCANEATARALYAQVYGEAAQVGKLTALPEARLLPYLAARSDRKTYLLYDQINFYPPDGVVEELKRGLAWHEEGKSGKGLQPATVAWARRLSKGQPISPAKAKKMAAWFKRHEVDKKGTGFSPGEEGFPSPGRVAWALWGGDAAVAWSNKLVRQLEAAARA